MSELFDLSIEFKNSILTLLNQKSIVELQGELLLLNLTKKGFLSLDIRKHETQEGADVYCKVYVENYLNKTIEEQWYQLQTDVLYWSDRWCYARAYTFKYIWECLSEGKDVKLKG
jgi:hypothetical protein